jgi:hypothetical protein
MLRLPTSRGRLALSQIICTAFYRQHFDDPHIHHARIGFEGEAGGSYVRSMKMVLKGRYASEASGLPRIGDGGFIL